MSGTRRSFLAGMGAALGFSTASPLLAVNRALGTKAPSCNDTILLEFTPETFKPLVGNIFRLTDAKLGVIILVLTSVTTVKQTSPPPNTLNLMATQRHASFALRFRQASGKKLTQGTYTMIGPSIGKFPLFLVPNSKSNSPNFYTAVINRV